MCDRTNPEDQEKLLLDCLASSEMWETVTVLEDQDLITVFSSKKALEIIRRAKEAHIFLHEYDVARAIYHQVEAMSVMLTSQAKANQLGTSGTSYWLELSSAKCRAITYAIDQAITLIKGIKETIKNPPERM